MSKEKDITFVRMAYKRKTLCKWSGCPWMVYASLNNGLWKAELRVARTRPSLVNGEASISSASQQQPWKACIGNDWYHADASFALEISPYTTYFMWLAYRKNFVAHAAGCFANEPEDEKVCSVLYIRNLWPHHRLTQGISPNCLGWRIHTKGNHGSPTGKFLV